MQQVFNMCSKDSNNESLMTDATKDIAIHTIRKISVSASQTRLPHLQTSYNVAAA